MAARMATSSAVMRAAPVAGPPNYSTKGGTNGDSHWHAKGALLLARAQFAMRGEGDAAQFCLPVESTSQ
eukprot:10765376-Lingulodinium_polyedra.AAC.1